MTSTAPRRLGLLAVIVLAAWLGARLIAGGLGRRPVRTAPRPPAARTPEAEAAPPAAAERAIIVPPPPPAPPPAPAPAPISGPAEEAPVEEEAPARRQRAVAAATSGAVLTRPLPLDEIAPDPYPEHEQGELPAWVEPIGTACPPTHPVKAKLSSHLYHETGMLAYKRTHPDRCYRDAEAAERDGFVRSKR